MQQKFPFAAVLFDLDGTLIDAFAPIVLAMRETLKHYHLPEMSDVAIRRHTGRGDCSMTALFGDQKAEATAFFLAVHDAVYLNDIKVLDGVVPMLDFLQAQDIPVGIVTSKGQHRAQAQLEKLGWLDKFDCIIGKVEGRPEKPDPAPVYLACDRLQVDAKDVVLIGDGESDMKAAYRAGCVGVGLTSSFAEAELLAAGANVCVENMHEVLAWLQIKIN